MLSEIYPELLWLLFTFLGGGVLVHFKDYRKKKPKDTPKKSINISEPVLSFVEEVKNNPSRFKIYRGTYNMSNEFIDEAITVYSGHLLVDKKTDIYYSFMRDYHTGFIQVYDDTLRILDSFRNKNYRVKTESLEWLTEDEKKYLYRELYLPYQEKEERYKEVLRLRKEKNHRRKLRKLYQKEKQ